MIVIMVDDSGSGVIVIMVGDSNLGDAIVIMVW